MKNWIKLAAANGVKVAEDIVERYKATFSRLPESAITSLYRDIKDKKPNTEFDAVIGKAYKMAVKYGVDAPCITKTYEKYKK